MRVEIDSSKIIKDAEEEIEDDVIEIKYPDNININNWNGLAKKTYDNVKKK